MPHGTNEAEDHHSNFYDARVNLELAHEMGYNHEGDENSGNFESLIYAIGACFQEDYETPFKPGSTLTSEQG